MSQAVLQQHSTPSSHGCKTTGTLLRHPHVRHTVAGLCSTWSSLGPGRWNAHHPPRVLAAGEDRAGVLAQAAICCVLDVTRPLRPQRLGEREVSFSPVTGGGWEKFSCRQGCTPGPQRPLLRTAWSQPLPCTAAHPQVLGRAPPLFQSV